MARAMPWWVVALCAVCAAAGGRRAAVLPPPWADARRNPCAAQPRGWQMLYWPADGKCYTIFKKGYPCPESMELAPGAGGAAQCACPPGHARLPRSTLCHELYARGPCLLGHYFAPIQDTYIKSGERRGACVKSVECAEATHARWPRDGRCYRRLSRGPCPLGQLITVGGDGIAECGCSKEGALGEHYWSPEEGCFELLSRGPCQRGELFLLEARAGGAACGCVRDLPHHHPASDGCYEIDTIGPCRKGHIYSINNQTTAPMRAECRCKDFHILWSEDLNCYRAYTQGPCQAGHMIVSDGTCVKIPCGKGRLYFPQQKRCYKLGTPGPCIGNKVVAYDFDTRPSIDGLSYNGICTCKKALYELFGECPDDDAGHKERCADKIGMVAVNDVCYMLYTQGPCREGKWLVPKKKKNSENGAIKVEAECKCRPNYQELLDSSENNTSVSITCIPPSVVLAKYLNNINSNALLGKQ